MLAGLTAKQQVRSQNCTHPVLKNLQTSASEAEELKFSSGLTRKVTPNQFGLFYHPTAQTKKLELYFSWSQQMQHVCREFSCETCQFPTETMHIKFYGIGLAFSPVLGDFIYEIRGQQRTSEQQQQAGYANHNYYFPRFFSVSWLFL